MSALVDFVGDIVQGAVDIVSGVVESVGDLVEDVVDIVEDAGSWIDDNVLQPLKEDPIGTIATIAAVATGNAHLVPYINAANTAAKGGDLGDVALSFGASYVGGKAGQVVGQQVSQSLSTVVVDAAGNVTYVPTITGNIAASTAAGATRGAVSTGLQGGDIEKGLLTGAATGAAGGIGREAGQLVFDETGSKVAADITAGVTRGATQAALTDRDIGVGAIMGGTNAALNTAVNFGSEYLFGEKKDQEDWQKAVTQAVGTQFTKAGMQEVYENVADIPTRPQPTQVAMQAQPTVAPTGFKVERGDFELRRFVNDEGDVIMIAFRDGKPQQTIPLGYKEEKAGTVRTPTATQVASARQPTGTQTATPTGVTPLPSVGIQAPASTVQRSGSNVTIKAAKGGLAVKKEKKPKSSKGLAAKKK